MRYLSLFSGIEMASLAFGPLGFELVAVAEVDEFASAVIAHHHPGIPNLGDVSVVTDEHVRSLGKVDAVIGGFPCQDLSNAGKRKGLRNPASKAGPPARTSTARAVTACPIPVSQLRTGRTARSKD